MLRNFNIFVAGFAVFLGLFAAACQDPGDDDDSASPAAEEFDDDSDDDQFASIDSCFRAVVTSGMGLSWKWLNHRISLWGVYPRQDACPDFGDIELAAEFVGGNWSTGQTLTDTPSVDYRYTIVDGDKSMAFLPLRATLWLAAPEDEAEAALEIPLAEKGMDGYESYLVLLNGLELSTDVPQYDPEYPADYDPALGYTSRGIGAGVGDLNVDGQTATFTAWARFDHGPADRDDMNRAMARARTKAVVHVLIVGMNGGAATMTDHGYDLIYDPPSLLFQSKYEHAPEDMRRVEIDGDAGYEKSFIALQSFNFDIFGSTHNGDYIRDFSVQALMTDYDPGSGKALVDLDGYASNASLLTYEQMENSFCARVALIQIPGGAAESGHIESEFETGETLLPLIGND